MEVVSRAVSTLVLLLGGGGLFAILLRFQALEDTETWRARGTCPLLCGAGMGSWPAWHPCPLPRHVFHAIPVIKTRACEIQREASDLVLHWSCFIEERIEVQNSNWWPEFICWSPSDHPGCASCPPGPLPSLPALSPPHCTLPFIPESTLQGPLCGLPAFRSTGQASPSAEWSSWAGRLQSCSCSIR